MATTTTTPEPNTSLIDGTRSYYEQFVKAAAVDQPDRPMPAFDDLTSDQARAWMLAYAANIDLAVRISDAVLTLGMEAS